MKDLNSLFAAAENVVIPATSNSKSVNGSAQENLSELLITFQVIASAFQQALQKR